jgi:hypothetical protein
MKYTPYLMNEKAVRLIEYLTKDKPLPRSYARISEEEMIDLLLYRIKKQSEHIDNLDKRIKDYQSVFDSISRFTRNNSIKG